MKSPLEIADSLFGKDASHEAFARNNLHPLGDIPLEGAVQVKCLPTPPEVVAEGNEELERCGLDPSIFDEPTGC